MGDPTKMSLTCGDEEPCTLVAGSTAGPIILRVGVFNEQTRPTNPLVLGRIESRLVDSATGAEVPRSEKKLRVEGGVVSTYLSVEQRRHIFNATEKDASGVVVREVVDAMIQVDASQVDATGAQEINIQLKPVVRLSVRTVVVRLVDAANTVISPATDSVRFGLFDGAAVVTDNDAIGPGPGADPLLNNDTNPNRNVAVRKKYSLYNNTPPFLHATGETEAESEGYVSADSRRFYVEVDDSGDGTPPADTIRVSLRTLSGDGTVLDANQGVPSLTLRAKSPGRYRSEACLLVVREEDRDIAHFCGVSLKPLYASTSLYRGRGDRDHRIRLARMSGKLQVQYDVPGESTSLSFAVFQRGHSRALPVQFFVVTRPSDGAPAVTLPRFSVLFREARETFERIGVALRCEQNTAYEAHIAARLAAGDPESRWKVRQSTSTTSDFFYILPHPPPVTSDLFSEGDLHLTTALTVADPNVIRAFFIEDFANKQLSGLSFGVTDTHVSSRWTSMISAHKSLSRRHLIAHEASHHLGDNGGHMRPPAAPEPRLIPFYNLMGLDGGLRDRIWDANLQSDDGATVNLFQAIHRSSLTRPL